MKTTIFWQQMTVTEITGQCKGVYIAEKMVLEKNIILWEGKEVGGGWGWGWGGGEEQIMIGLLNGKIMGPWESTAGKKL
jgi:hypothetical protein